MSCPAVRHSRGYPVILFCGILKDLCQSIKKVVYFQSHLFNLCTAIVNCIYFMEFQVASFLYFEEKMNVLVEPEPDVHDIFARGHGFCPVASATGRVGYATRVPHPLLESQGSDLFRPFIVKTPGSGTPCVKSNNIEIVVNIPILH